VANLSVAIVIPGTCPGVVWFDRRQCAGTNVRLCGVTAHAACFQMSYAKRVPGLDGLRGIAAIAVMLFHFNVFFLPQAHLPFLSRAYLAVDLFFVLSGFVMAHVYGRQLASNWRDNWVVFARARFARIYPLYAVTTLAMVILVTLSSMPLALVSFSGTSLALQPFLLQQWAPSLSWDYPSWSISTEAEAYVFFAIFAGLIVTGKRPRLMTACCIAVVTALSIAKGGSLNSFHGPSALLRTLAEFCLGVMLYRAYSAQAGFPVRAAILAVLFAGLATITHMDFVAVGAFACVIYYGAKATDVFGKILNARPLVALGNWSYAIYLWHAPTHYAVMIAFAAAGFPVSNLGLISSRLLVAATAILVVGLSALHYRYFETPIRRFILTWPGPVRHHGGDMWPADDAHAQ
jgi:peptidoglycan/LPS O-acetylase OafA/YrhL